MTAALLRKLINGQYGHDRRAVLTVDHSPSTVNMSNIVMTLMMTTGDTEQRVCGLYAV